MISRPFRASTPAPRKTPKKPVKKAAKKAAKNRKSRPAAATPALLAGGNPQIAKADGDAPVQAYIAAMPGWKRDVGRRLDALIVRNVPNVRKAVKWNSPFYGIEGQGWFLNFPSRSTSRWLSSAARRCVLSLPASPSTRTRATSTSTRTTSSTRSSSRVGLGRHRSCPVGSRSAGLWVLAGRNFCCRWLIIHVLGGFPFSEIAIFAAGTALVWF